MIEIWKDIPGYESKYQVSNLGRVRSLDYFTNARGMKKTRPVKGKILKIQNDGKGYKICRLGSTTSKGVHRLVAMVFCDNKNNLNVVDHIDGNRSNNVPSNLEWVTSCENNRRIYRYGRGSVGEHRPASKLTEKDIKHIRDEYNYCDGKRGILVKLSDGYGVSKTVIHRIVRLNAWVHV